METGKWNDDKALLCRGKSAGANETVDVQNACENIVWQMCGPGRTYPYPFYCATKSGCVDPKVEENKHVCPKDTVLECGKGFCDYIDHPPPS